MGYISLETSDIANFNKAVMVVWFRIPQEAITAAQALDPAPESGITDEFFNDFIAPPLHRIIPLITFGSQEVTLSGAGVGADIPVSPSYIGVNCQDGGGDVYLSVNLQTGTTASYNDTPESPEDEHVPTRYFFEGSDLAQVTADEWHVALVAFDISQAVSITWFDTLVEPFYEITFGPTCSRSLDDVSNVLDDEIIPQTFFTVPEASDTDDGDFELSVSGATVEQSGNPMGIPASADYVANVYNIQMAEVRIFTDVSEDVTSEAIRRLFITADGGPAHPSLAEDHFGKVAEVYFKTHDDFINGNNRGTAGNFTPAGTILPYTPGP